VLPLVEFLLASIVVGASGVAKDATREAELKDHLKWAWENFETTQKKITTAQKELVQVPSKQMSSTQVPLQAEDQRNSSCITNKCSLKNSTIPAGDELTNQETLGRETILVFVSFSMPEASLKSLAREAERANAVLIIRGLIEDSFKITMIHLKDYALSVEVNPDLFEQYNIQHVPTFVKLKDGQEQARLSGNVTLTFAAQKLGISS